MKTLKQLFALTLTLCLAVSLFSAVNVSAGENLVDNMASNNYGMYAVPRKGEVNVDGTFDEWDWSGRIMIFPDYDNISKKSAEVAAMYDESFLYLGFKVKDETPMLNTRDPIMEYSSTWRGDSFQIRVISDHCQWITTAYHKNVDQYSFYVDNFAGKTTNDASASHLLYYSEPGSTKVNQVKDFSTVPIGVYDTELEICCRYDTQVSGTYYYEMKIPHSVIWNDKGKWPKAGDMMIMAFEVYWSDETGYNVGSNYKDNLQAGEASREFFYKKQSIWGNLSFSGENDIETRNYVKDKQLPMSGYLKIPIEAPKDKDYITVVVEDSKGNRVRNLIAELKFKEYEEYYVSETETTYTSNVLWDGRDDYGNKVSPGKYTFRTIAYNGLDPVFDTVYYGPGQIPWSISSDKSSGWLADHTPPSTVATYGNEVYVGAAFAEGGHGLMGLDSATGNKKWGTTLGAHLLAANSRYIFAIPGWDWTQDMTISLNQILLRYDRETASYDPFVINGEKQQIQMYMSDILGVKNGESVPNVTGLDANEDYVAIATDGITGTSGMDITLFGTALKYPDSVQFYSTSDLTPIKRVYVDDVGAIAYSKDGQHLYAITGKNGIVEINPVTGKKTEVKLLGVDSTMEFTCIETDNDGNLVLFDNGDDCQIKTYSVETGKLLYTAAQQGGRPYDGLWEEQGLTHETSDIAVDNDGNIWVTEDWNYPRRISKWSPEDGKLIKDFIGATFYMGGNSGVNQDDPDLVYWGPVEMRVNREDCSYKVERILYIPDALEGEIFAMDSGGNMANQVFKSDASGEMKNYVFACGVLYIETETGRYRPCAAVGSGIPSLYSYNKTRQYDPLKIPDYAAACGGPWSDENHKNSKWIWNDYNCDGKVQDTEVVFFKSSYYNIYNNAASWLPTHFNWSCYMTDSLSFSAYNIGGNYYFGSAALGIYSPVDFSEDGAPFYSVNNLKIVLDPAVAGQASEHYYFEDEGTAIIIPANSSANDYRKTAIRCVDVDTGELVWSYRNDYAGVAGSHSSPTQPENGFVIGSLKLMGIYHNTQGDKFIHIRGNVGTDYIMTSDGFFVSTLFGDNRVTSSVFPESVEAAKGMSMNHLSTGGEPFGGNGATQEDGVTRFILTTGGRCAIVVRLENMDSIEYLDPITITYTREDFDAAYAYVEEKPGAEEEVKDPASTVYEIKKATDGFTIDGELDDWDGYPSLTVEQDGVHERSVVKMAYDAENLYVSFETRDDSPMKNSGVDYQKLFKTGDVADIFLSPTGNKTDDAADGDMRITFSVLNGKEVAVLSKKVDTTAKAGEGFSYSSPVRTLEFAKCVILSDAEIGIVRSDTGYMLEAKVPLSSINVTVDTNKTMTGDVGIIKSDDAGSMNLARVYYFNKNTGLISDLPGESDFYPSRWGSMKFVDSDPRLDN